LPALLEPVEDLSVARLSEHRFHGCIVLLPELEVEVRVSALNPLGDVDVGLDDPHHLPLPQPAVEGPLKVHELLRLFPVLYCYPRTPFSLLHVGDLSHQQVVLPTNTLLTRLLDLLLLRIDCEEGVDLRAGVVNALLGN